MIMFKRVIENVLILIFFFISLFFSYRLLALLSKIRIRIYSFWIRPCFGSIGKDVVIQPFNQLTGSKYIHIGSNCTFGDGVFLTAIDHYNTQRFTPEIFIGDNCSIGQLCHISAINLIQIGNNVLMGKMITITDNSHGLSTMNDLQIEPINRLLNSKGPTIIGDNVWIGDKATILPGITIGDNSIVGANSVVTHSIPPFSVCVGNPAKIIKILNNV